MKKAASCNYILVHNSVL